MSEERSIKVTDISRELVFDFSFFFLMKWSVKGCQNRK